jgi:hypothetical protein
MMQNLCSDGAWFILSGYRYRKSHMYCSTQNYYAVVEVTLHCLNFGIWCEMSVRMTVWFTYVCESNSKRYMWLILWSFFDQLTDEENSWGHFIQDNATPHTMSNSMDAVDKDLDELVIQVNYCVLLNHRISVHVTSISGARWKKTCVKNSDSLREIQEDIRHEIPHTPVQPFDVHLKAHSHDVRHA